VLNLLIWLVAALLLVSFAWWLIDYIPVPEPINRWAKIVVIFVAVILVVNVLLSLAGSPLFPMVPR
jgi:cadmium resistance protein CadD (predicted permease)